VVGGKIRAHVEVGNVLVDDRSYRIGHHASDNRVRFRADCVAVSTSRSGV